MILHQLIERQDALTSGTCPPRRIDLVERNPEYIRTTDCNGGVIPIKNRPGGDKGPKSIRLDGKPTEGNLLPLANEGSFRVEVDM